MTRSEFLGSDTKRLTVALILVIGYAVIEVIAAIVTGSLSLLSDAGHMGTDALGLAMSLAAILTVTNATRRQRQTFGLFDWRSSPPWPMPCCWWGLPPMPFTRG